MLSSEEDQNQRWVEHFSEVLKQANPDSLFDFTSENDINGNNPNIILDDIQCDELTEAIKTLKNNKASGIDNLPAGFFIFVGGVIIEKPTDLGTVISFSEEVPNEWTKGCTVELLKKGSVCDCDNVRGITLLTIARESFCKVLLMRLRKDIDLKLCENQAGSRTSRSCTEQIFTLSNIIEQSLEYRVPMIINYIDFKKSFDSVQRPLL